MVIEHNTERAGETAGSPACTPAAVLIDDNPDDRSTAELLSGTGLATTALAPAKTAEATVQLIRERLSTESAGLVLLDYRLEEAPGIGFRGGSVAASLREFEADWPVVLYTTAERLRTWVQQQPAIHDLFDWQLLKHEVVESDRRVGAVRSLIDIACGYARLREVLLQETGGVWDVIAAALRCERDELAPFKTGEEPPRTVSGVGRWLLRDVLRHVGPLVSAHEARVLLGIDRKGFAESPVEEFLAPARYRGILGGLAPRWWRGRLFGLLDEAEIKGDARQRAARLSELLDMPLTAEGCSWCEQFGTVRPCAVCGRAVDAAHAVTVLDDPSLPWGGPGFGDAPRWAAQPLACYRCIVEGRAEGLRFPESSEDIVEELRSGGVTAPADDRRRDGE